MFRNDKIFMLLFLLLSCTNGDKKVSKSSLDNKDCVVKLEEFATRLSIDSVGYLNDYFSDQKLSIENCYLDRNNPVLKEAISLIFLKINYYYLLNGMKTANALPLFGISPSMTKIVYEFNFLISKKDAKYPEVLLVSDVLNLVASDKILMSKATIKHWYLKNLEMVKKMNKPTLA